MRHLIYRVAAVALLSFVIVLPMAATDSAFVTAAKDGDLRAVRADAKRVNVNEPAKDGSTALLWAVYHSDAEMTKALLTAGAKVDTPNSYGVTPLIQAGRSGDTALIDLPLKAGAKASLAHPDGETALMAASRTGRADAVRLLIEAGSDVNATSYQQETALMWAAAEGRTRRCRVKALLDAKADPNRKARVTTIEERSTPIIQPAASRR
jgi:ankyrin repeat protein